MPSIMILDTYYFEFLKSQGFVSTQSSDNFDEISKELASKRFGTGSSYAHYLRKYGWDAELIIPNALRVQNSWRLKHNLRPAVSIGWKYGLYLARLPLSGQLLNHIGHIHGTIIEQAKILKPDVIYVQDINLLMPATVNELKKYTKKIVGEIASPLPPLSFLAGYDLIVSALPSIVNQANEMGIRSFSLPLGFDPRNTQYQSHSERTIDALFIGSFYRNQPGTFEMLKIASQIIPNLQIYGPGASSKLKEHGLQDNYFGEAWGPEMFKLLGNSKVVLNRHGSAAGDFAVNMRMYEATGMGAALVTENKSNLTELFIPGEEVIPYNSPKEAAESAANILSDPKALKSIAENGQKKTLEFHGYSARMKSLSHELEELIKV